MQEKAVKRVTKNTIIMFIRMVVLMAINFLASRWLLKQLGVEDYGIYSVVGSVTTTFIALKGLFTESIQRFLNYYKGKDDGDAQKSVFSISIYVHVVLAILFVVILEVVGTWLIDNKLVFPAEKYDTVIFVFQMTVIASVFSIFCIPFDALIIANEQMGFFAFISVLDGFFRLVVVLALPFIPFESLRVYSLLLIFIPLSTLFLVGLYSRRFPECSISKSIDTKMFNEIISLSGWNFFGNISFSLLHEGINFTLNIFGGLAYNAARAIAYQIKSIAVQFSNNSLIAARPMIMQSAAIDNGNDTLYKNIIEVSRISFFIMLIPILPLEVYCSELLEVWLVDVPQYSTTFSRLVLASVLIRSLHEPINMLYMSVGKIKRMMLLEVIIMLASLVMIYISLSIGFPMWTAFAILAIMEAVIILALVINAKFELSFYSQVYFSKVITPVLLLLVICLLIGYLFSLIIVNSILIVLLLCLAIVLIVMGMIVLVANDQEKSIVRNLLLSKFKIKI